jgi:hypothetical protein
MPKKSVIAFYMFTDFKHELYVEVSQWSVVFAQWNTELVMLKKNAML